MSWTNNGIEYALGVAFDSQSVATGLRLVLITAAAAPTVDTSTFSGLTEIAAGNGYTTGGITVTMGTDTTLTQDDANNLAKIVIADKTITASGGAVPASGSGARYVVLTDANATLNSRQVYAWWDLGGDVTIGSGNSLLLDDLTLRGLS